MLTKTIETKEGAHRITNVQLAHNNLTVLNNAGGGVFNPFGGSADTDARSGPESSDSTDSGWRNVSFLSKLESLASDYSESLGVDLVDQIVSTAILEQISAIERVTLGHLDQHESEMNVITGERSLDVKLDDETTDSDLVANTLGSSLPRAA